MQKVNKMQILNIVKYFIYLNKKLNFKIQAQDKTAEYEPITHLKIQKLLYYTQALSLVYLNKPLFKDDIQAWEHGPVVKSVFKHLKKYKSANLDEIKELQYTDLLTEEEKSIIKMVFKEYGIYTALALRNKTHNEPAWLNAFKKGKNTIITHNEMLKFFKKQRKDIAEQLYNRSKEYRCLFK